jgi:dihydrofolate reductase
MGIVFVDMGVSLDGFIAGPNGRPGNPLGDGGPRIHEWLFSLFSFRRHLGLDGGEVNADDAIVRKTLDRIGANVMGRRMFDEGEVGWPEEAPFHGPVFVLTHHPRAPWMRPGGTTFTFLGGTIEDAVQKAHQAAGGRDVRISGGAQVVQQALRAGLVDELTLHVAPILLGNGVRLFDGLGTSDLKLEPAGVATSPAVTHLTYRVRR